MKNKLLLLGNNKRLITDFFMQMDFFFECVSSSTIAADMKAHYNFFEPDAIVYCMRAENRDNIVSVTSFIEKVVNDSIPFVVIADVSDYEFLTKMPGGRADLRMTPSVPAQEMQSEIKGIISRTKTQPMADAKPKADENVKDVFDILAKLETELAQIDEFPPDKIRPKAVKKEANASERQRILVVDDSTVIHKAIKSYAGEEYDISAAISGTAALRFLQTKEVNLILLDYEMPEMDGADVLEQIRGNKLTAEIPVVFLTGVNDVEKIQKALRFRPNGYLLKPIDKEVLLGKLHEVLG